MTKDEQALLVAVARAIVAGMDTPRSTRLHLSELLDRMTLAAQPDRG